MTIGEQGTWRNGYRPQAVRIGANHDIAGTWNLLLQDGFLNTIATVSIPQGGGKAEANCTFGGPAPGGFDMFWIKDTQAPVGQIYDIEFFVCGASFSSSSSSCSSSSSTT